MLPSVSCFFFFFRGEGDAIVYPPTCPAIICPFFSLQAVGEQPSFSLNIR